MREHMHAHASFPPTRGAGTVEVAAADSVEWVREVDKIVDTDVSQALRVVLSLSSDEVRATAIGDAVPVLRRLASSASAAQALQLAARDCRHR